MRLRLPWPRRREPRSSVVCVDLLWYNRFLVTQVQNMLEEGSPSGGGLTQNSRPMKLGGAP